MGAPSETGQANSPGKWEMAQGDFPIETSMWDERGQVAKPPGVGQAAVQLVWHQQQTSGAIRDAVYFWCLTDWRIMAQVSRSENSPMPNWNMRFK